MQASDRSWLPNTPREGVFLFSLSLSLMLNTTVVLLLVTGDLPVLADLQAKPTVEIAEHDTQQDKPVVDLQTVDQPAESQWGNDSQPVFTETREPSVVEVVPVVNDTFEPTPVVSVAPAAVAPDPVEPVQQAQPKQDDDPVTFFGIGLE